MKDKYIWISPKKDILINDRMYKCCIFLLHLLLYFCNPYIFADLVSITSIKELCIIILSNMCVYFLPLFFHAESWCASSIFVNASCLCHLVTSPAFKYHIFSSCMEGGLREATSHRETNNPAKTTVPVRIKQKDLAHPASSLIWDAFI